MDDRAGKPDAAACGLSVDAEGVDVVLGLTILPYCNVPGLKCVAMGFIRRQTAKRHYTKRLASSLRFPMTGRMHDSSIEDAHIII